MNQKANLKTVTLKDLWGVFVQRLWAIILAACICCGGLLVFNRMTFVPQYASTATLYILRQADGATASDASSDFSLALKVREVFALTNQLGNFFRFVRSFFEIFQKNFFDHLSGTKKAPITSQRCNRGRNRKSPLIEISGLKSYEIIVCYRNLSAIAKFQTHFWRKLGVNWRKLWRKHRQFRVNQ